MGSFALGLKKIKSGILEIITCGAYGKYWKAKHFAKHGRYGYKRPAIVL